MKNPSAFPSPGVVMPDGRQQGAYEGMALRDYFAAAALTGMYAGYQGNAPEPEQVASDAYFIADRMIEERERES